MNKIRFGFFTDTHGRGDTPVGRNDSFREALLKKLVWLGEFWQEQEVDILLFGGDLFHTPDPSNGIVNDILPVLRSWNLPMYGVVGSHDYYGYQMRSLNRTALGILHNAGVITLVGGYAQPKFLTVKLNGVEVTITGTPHTFDLAEEYEVTNVPKYNQHAHLQIQLVHGDLLVKPAIWPHYLVEQLDTKSELVLSGHYHPGWKDVVTSNGTSFVNPGAICRLENTGKERIPRVNIIDVYDTGKFDITFHDVEAAAKHPFHEKVVKDDKIVVQDLQRLFALIGDTTVDVVDVKAQIPIVAKELQMGENIVKLAFDLIDEVT